MGASCDEGQSVMLVRVVMWFRWHGAEGDIGASCDVSQRVLCVPFV